MMSRKRKDKPKVDPPVTETEGDAANDETLELADGPLEVTGEVAEYIAHLEAERDEAFAGRQRAQADYLNFQRRSRENEIQAKHDGSVKVVRALLPALDHVDLAMVQDAEQLTVQQLLDGMQMIRRELSAALEGCGVQRIEPETGEEFNPNHHQAMMRVPTDEQESNTIVSAFQVGYMMKDLVLRPASVTVAAPPEPTAVPPEDDTEPDQQEGSVDADV